MQVFETVMCGLLIAFALFLVIAILLQHGSDHNLSGVIGGGAESLFGKTKAKKADAALNKLTTIVSIAFVVIVLIVYILQPNYTASVETPGWRGSDKYDSSVINSTETEAASGAEENGSTEDDSGAGNETESAETNAG